MAFDESDGEHPCSVLRLWSLQVKSYRGLSGWGWKGNHELALIKSISQGGRKKKALVSCRNSRIEGSC